MISITNDARLFFEDEQGEIIIYGAGNAGYWIGYYMNRCNIEYTCYVDQKACNKGLYNGKPVFGVEKLSEYKGRTVRIICTPKSYNAVLEKLLWCSQKVGFDALCMVPKYVHITTKEDEYHINRFLAYFRRKLFKGEIPTIISNNCSAGFIYQMMDMVMLSPTINTGIYPNDYIKLCRNLKYYLGQEMKELHWERPYGNPQHWDDLPAGNIADVTVMFGHVDSTEGLIERWNMMRKQINWNRIIFVGCDHDLYMPFKIKEEEAFMGLPGEHLLFVMRNEALWGSQNNNKVFMQQNYLEKRDSAIENYFDLLGWLNKEYEDETD